MHRYAPVDFLSRYLSEGFFDYAIADEVHELKGGETAQGNALGALARCAEHIVILTGTLLGGLGGLAPLGAVPLVVALLAASLWAVESWVRNADDPGASLGWHRGLGPLACALLLMAIVLFTPTDTRSFIYFQF